MSVYFTSDLHLGHRLVASKRGFASVKEHNEEVLHSLVSGLSKRNMLWVLGDIAFRAEDLHILGAIPGPMRAVLGNHDNLEIGAYTQYFSRIDGAVKKYGMFMTHVPIHPQELYRVTANVHGHIHKDAATPPLPFPYINVNWDFWKRPVSLDEIREKFGYVSHH